MKIHNLLEKYAGQPVEITYHGGLVPTQVQAEIAGYHLYYRARHGDFTICVADTEDHAIRADFAESDGVIYYLQGDDPTEGYVPEETYTEIVDKAIEFTLLYDTSSKMTAADWHNAIGFVCNNIMSDDERLTEYHEQQRRNRRFDEVDTDE